MLSYHIFVEIKINTNRVERGPWLWILNNSLLDKSDYSHLINSFWLSWRLKKFEFSCLSEWWEMAKHNIKQLSIQFSKEQQHQTENILKIEKELLILKEMPYSISTCTKIENIEKRIERYYNIKFNAFVVRSNAKFEENNELSSKYFYNLEKQRGKSKLKDDEGNVMSGLDSILKEQTKFYKSLFTSEGCDQHAADILLSYINVRLSDDESENLDKMMNIEEQSHQTF